jgi:hypothetical protein
MTIHFASWWIPLLVTLAALCIPIWWSLNDPYRVGFLMGMVPAGVISTIAWAVWGFLK